MNDWQELSLSNDRRTRFDRSRSNLPHQPGLTDPISRRRSIVTLKKAGPHPQDLGNVPVDSPQCARGPFGCETTAGTLAVAAVYHLMYGKNADESLARCARCGSTASTASDIIWRRTSTSSSQPLPIHPPAPPRPQPARSSTTC